jgi:hypothetical protein
MKIFKLTLLLFIIISCKQKSDGQKSELKSEKKEIELPTQEIDSVYEKYNLGKVESFDWELVRQRAKEYENVSSEYSDKNLIPEDFLVFANNFISSKQFQKEHIDYDNLIAVVGACEETYVLKKNNWVYDNWNFIEFIGIDEEMKNTFHYSDSIFYCKYVVKELGTIRILGFEKKDGKWNLTLYDNSDC